MQCIHVLINFRKTEHYSLNQGDLIMSAKVTARKNTMRDNARKTTRMLSLIMPNGSKVLKNVLNKKEKDLYSASKADIIEVYDRLFCNLPASAPRPEWGSDVYEYLSGE